MNLLLSFAPFLAFAVIERLAGAQAGLIAGALVAAAVKFTSWYPEQHAAGQASR